MQNHLNGGLWSWFRCLESASCAQLRARELGKITTLIEFNSQSLAKKSCPWVDRKIKPQRCFTGISMLHIISRAVWFRRITRRSWKIHSVDFIFHWKGYLFFSSEFLSSDGWLTDETYEEEVGQWRNRNIYQKFLSLSSRWQFLIVRWLKPIGMFWNCSFEAPLPTWKMDRWSWATCGILYSKILLVGHSGR